MAVTKIINKITLNTWYQTNIGNLNSCFLILEKETTAQGDAVDVKKVTRVTFALGIDSGVANTPLTIQRFTVDFKNAVLPDDPLFGTIGFSKLVGIPSEFYIKPIVVDDGEKEIGIGEVAIAVSLNPLKLA